MQDFDYIVVGSGSAGSVLANRLTADPSVRVLLIEAGPLDRSLYIRMPAAFAKPLESDRFNWRYYTEPEPFMDGRRLYCPRGRVLGGSSSINGMVYIRGHALDYDGWAAQRGMEQWSYAHCLPYFRRAETHEAGADPYHGGDGPLFVSAPKSDNPLYKAFVDAAQQAGFPFTSDMNGYQQEGFGPMEMTTRQGERWSAARAYLHPVRRRPNLTILLRTRMRRVVFRGKRATGVEVSNPSGVREIHATREVILCGGAINSPQLLLLSGIGHAEELRAMGIDVVAHLPGVGENLQDHLEIYVQHAATQPVSAYAATRPLGRLRVGLEWLLFRSGWGATNLFEAGGFVRSNETVEHPNLQYHFLPLAISYDGSSAHDSHGFQAHVGPMRPESRGSVKLRSADPSAPPRILFNYLMTETDRREMREAVRITRDIFRQPAFDPYRGAELAPGRDVASDGDIDAFVRAKGESAYHPSGSCKIGTDAMAVVDPACRVHGVEGLRVVDASIMPRIVSGNLNAPTIMIGEKAADMILGVEPLAPANAPVFVAPKGEIRLGATQRPSPP